MDLKGLTTFRTCSTSVLLHVNFSKSNQRRRIRSPPALRGSLVPGPPLPSPPSRGTTRHQRNDQTSPFVPPLLNCTTTSTPGALLVETRTSNCLSHHLTEPKQATLLSSSHQNIRTVVRGILHERGDTISAGRLLIFQPRLFTARDHEQQVKRAGKPDMFKCRRETLIGRLCPAD